MSKLPLAEFDHLDPELVADWLNAKPDFKVMRRIKDTNHLGGQVDQSITVVVVDTETTGLDFDQSYLIEVGFIAVQVDRITGKIGQVLGRYGGLEDPGVPISPESTKIHGITNEMIQDKRFDEQAIQALCQRADLFVAHNAGFDKPFITRRFPWLEETLWSCTYKELPLHQEGYSSGKLESLLNEIGYFHVAHRAVEDCLALLYFLARPLKESQRLPLTLIFDSSTESIYEIAAMNAPFEAKDTLKAKGFRWNAADRVWEYVAMGFLEGKEIIEWLRAQVYHTKDKISLGFKVRQGKDRYSKLPVRLQIKQV